VAAEVDGHLVAKSEIVRGTGYSMYVGFIDIAFKKGYRGVAWELKS
jgi:hypothetical protein